MTNPINNGPRVPGSKVGELGSRTPVGRQEQPQGVPGEKDAGPQGSAETSGRLQAIREAIAGTPEVDRARVDAIKERIAAGDYPVDADRVARKFIELEQLLGR